MTTDPMQLAAEHLERAAAKFRALAITLQEEADFARADFDIEAREEYARCMIVQAENDIRSAVQSASDSADFARGVLS